MLNQVASLSWSALARLVLDLEIGVNEDLSALGELAKACYGTFAKREDVVKRACLRRSLAVFTGWTDGIASGDGVLNVVFPVARRSLLRIGDQTS